MVPSALSPDITPSISVDAPKPPKLLDQVRARLRTKHYSIRTEGQYVCWIKRFIRFHGLRHPREMGAREVEAFLSDLAVNGQVAAATQNQALSALLFFYREVLEIELPWLENLTRAKPSQRLPVVLTPAEVRAVLERMEGVYGLMARLLYGTGMRLMDVLLGLALGRSALGCGAPPSYRREALATGDEEGGNHHAPCQARHAAYFAAFARHASSGSRL